MPPLSPRDQAQASWVRGDAAAAIGVALQHATDEWMLRAACAMALRSHRVDLLMVHIDDISQEGIEDSDQQVVEKLSASARDLSDRFDGKVCEG